MFPLFFFALFAISTSALALPAPGVRLEDIEDRRESTPAYDFSAIVGLDSCSGALVRYETSEDDDVALVMTNGHCVVYRAPDIFMPANTYLGDSPARNEFTLLGANGRPVGKPLQATKLLYATMVDTDIALYEVSLSYRAIEKIYGVRALVIDSKRATEHTAIEILSGRFAIGYTCDLEKFVYQLKEGDYLWKDSLRFTATCDTKAGTSGSPVLSRDKHKIIGINNTGNEYGKKCTMSNPCEISATGDIYFKKDLNYGQQTYTIYSCLDPKRKLNLALPGCLLFHGNKAP